MKKLKDYAMNEHHSLYHISIQREHPLYQREHDLRSPFFRDYTRLLFSEGYRRMKHKTQVFFAIDDDHVCTRSEHVNLVDSISHSIAKELGLNTELTQAIAIGHDIGHAPFGHGGEKILNQIAHKYHLDSFWHERNSLHFVDSIELLEDDEHHYHNLNLTYAVRDGIISHCGEVNQKIIIPRKDPINLLEFKKPGQYQPFTYEGCVVKMSDKIAYLARDIEDALHLGVITQEEVDNLKEELNQEGTHLSAINNGSIVNYFISDVIKYSSKEGIALSDESLKKMKQIMAFNYKHIYEIKRVKVHSEYVGLILNSLFQFLYDYNSLESIKAEESKYPVILRHYLNFLKKLAYFGERDEIYENEIVYDFTSDKQAKEKSIIDYLSGMTDSFLLKSFHDLLTFK